MKVIWTENLEYIVIWNLFVEYHFLHQFIEIKFTRTVLLAVRAELLFYDNIPVDKLGMKNERQTNLEYLGDDMIEAGNEFGTDTPYGSALVRVGTTQHRWAI